MNSNIYKIFTISLITLLVITRTYLKYGSTPKTKKSSKKGYESFKGIYIVILQAFLEEKISCYSINNIKYFIDEMKSLENIINFLKKDIDKNGFKNCNEYFSYCNSYHAYSLDDNKKEIFVVIRKEISKYFFEKFKNEQKKLDLWNFYGFIFTCQQFKILFPEKIYKFVNENYNSVFGDHQYILDEINKNKFDINLYKDHCEGEFYFTNETYVKAYSKMRDGVFPYGNVLLKIEFPDDEALVVVLKGQIICNTIIPRFEKEFDI